MPTPTVTDAPGRPLTELETAEAEAIAASQRAELARQRAEEAREQAQRRQEERQLAWAELEVAGAIDRNRHHAEVIGQARADFEAAVVDDPTKAITTFTVWTAALADRHAANASHDLAMSILGRTARLTEWPRLRFSAEQDAILERHAHGQLTAASEVEQTRRRAAFDGQEAT
jgi:hypothetical protein